MGMKLTSRAIQIDIGENLQHFKLAGIFNTTWVQVRIGSDQVSPETFKSGVVFTIPECNEKPTSEMGFRVFKGFLIPKLSRPVV